MTLCLRRALFGTILFVGGPLLFAQGVGTPPVVIENAGSQIGAAAKLNFSTGTSVSCTGGTCTVTASGSGGTGNPGQYTAVSFSATPTFTATSNTDNSWSITLTGNVTSSALASSAAGQILHFKVCQDATGGRTFAWPTGFTTAATISPIASSCTRQAFFWDGSAAQSVSPATVDSGPGYVGLQAAPSGNPGSGFVYSWCDSTALTCEVKNSAGSVFAMAMKGGDYNPVTGVVTGINGGAVTGTSGAVVCFTTSNQIIPCTSSATIPSLEAASTGVLAFDNGSGTADAGVSRFTTGWVAVGNGTQGSTTGVLVSGAYVSEGHALTISGCSATTVLGGASAASFVSGTTGTCTVVITINGATGLSSPHGWFCSAHDITTPVNFVQTASTVSTCTISGTTVNGDTITFGATGF